VVNGILICRRGLRFHGGGGYWLVAAQTCLNGAKTFTDCFP
jgi:hypothetical protein